MPARIFDGIVYVYSLLGLMASVYIAAAEVISFPEELPEFPGLLARVTVFALFPVSFLLILRMKSLQYDMSQRQINEAGISGCPVWMRSVANILLLVGLILFFVPMLLELFHYLPHKDGGFFPATTSGGFGILAYSSIFVQLYSANVLSRKQP